MANKFAFGLVAAGALTGICIGIGQVMTEHLAAAAPVATDWRTKVGEATPAELVQPAPKAAPVPAPKEQEVAQTDALGEWAVRAYDAEQAHQDRCWDQLEERGYGDASCY